jgi:hypothetical protein
VGDKTLIGSAKRVLPRTWTGVLAILIAVSAAAHHSTAMYDLEKTTTLKGTIKSFHWTNPHCSIELFVSDREQWNIQLGPPTRLYREDWKRIAFKPGNAITALVHPMRDGTHVALFVSGTGPDGNPL